MPAAAVRNSHATFQAKQPFAHAWYVADVEGKTLGRAATKIASVLRGKHRADASPPTPTPATSWW